MRPTKNTMFGEGGRPYTFMKVVSTLLPSFLTETWDISPFVTHRICEASQMVMRRMTNRIRKGEAADVLDRHHLLF